MEGDAISPEVMARQYAAMEGWQGALPRMKSVDVPTLHICGDLDHLAPWETGRRMAAEMPMDELLVAEGFGHGFPYQDPEWLWEPLRGF